MSTRRAVETSNEDKVLFPGADITKGDLIEYYGRIAEHALPHLKDRPLVLQRFPDGIDGEGFYQKQVRQHFPDWIETVCVPLKSKDDEQELVVCNEKATLVYLANQACITLHPWLSRRGALARPDQLIIDLDPADDDFQSVRSAALRTRELLDALGLPSFIKLTGSKGLHVVVPLRGDEGFDDVRRFAREATGWLAARHREELTTEQRKDKRHGRLYLDVGRNAYAQTAVAPWSVRALAGAPVAAPIEWRDLERGHVGPRDYTVKNVFRSLAQREDPWSGFRKRSHSLSEPRRRLRQLIEERKEA